MALSEWYKQLYGPKTISYNPAQVQFDDFSQIPTQPNTVKDAIKEIIKESGEGGDGTSGLSAKEKELMSRGGTPRVDDPAFWGHTGFTPNLSIGDVARAYGPYMALGPMMGGLRMAKTYMNPTKDPLFQKAAGQYLNEYAPGVSLDQILQEINTLYTADPDAKVNAMDSARGVLMGQGPLAQQYQQAVLQQGLAPYTFAQAVQGLNAISPGLAKAPGAFTNFSDVPSLSNLAAYGYSNTPQPSHIPDLAAGIEKGEYRSDGPVAQSIQRSISNEASRASSRAWMDEVLGGKTTKNYSDWQRDGRNDNDDGWDTPGGWGGSGDYGRGNTELEGSRDKDGNATGYGR